MTEACGRVIAAGLSSGQNRSPSSTAKASTKRTRARNTMIAMVGTFGAILQEHTVKLRSCRSTYICVLMGVGDLLRCRTDMTPGFGRQVPATQRRTSQ